MVTNLMIFFDSEKNVYQSSLYPTWLFHGFSTKKIGDGRRKAIINKLSYNVGHNLKIVIPKQVHGAKILVVKQSMLTTRLNFLPVADGLITSEKGVILTIVTADCLPIIYADWHSGLIGISHQGWRGLYQELPHKMIASLLHLGASRERIICLLGPAIGECCYEIDKNLLTRFRSKFSDLKDGQANPKLNLLALAYQQLLRAGINPAHIDFRQFCTFCQKEEFWSYRRDRKICGEMLNFVVQ